MFFSTQLLEKKGHLAIAWLCAHDQFKKLGKSDLKVYDLSQVCLTITNPGKVPFSLRTSGQLMYGVVQIYRRKVEILLRDSSDVVARIRIRRVSAQAAGTSDDEASDADRAPAGAPARREKQREARREAADPLFDFEARPNQDGLPDLPAFDRDYDYAGAMSQLGALTAVDLGVPLHVLEQKHGRAASTNASSHSTKDELENVAAGGAAAAAGGALDFGAVGDDVGRGPQDFPVDGEGDFPAFPDMGGDDMGMGVDVQLLPDELGAARDAAKLDDAVSLASLEASEPPRKVRRLERPVNAVVDSEPLFDLRNKFDSNVSLVCRRYAPFCPSTLAEISNAQSALLKVSDLALLPRTLPGAHAVSRQLTRLYADAFRQSIEATALQNTEGTELGAVDAEPAGAFGDDMGGAGLDMGGLFEGDGGYGAAAAPLVAPDAYSRDGSEVHTQAATQVSGSTSAPTSTDPAAIAAQEKGSAVRGFLRDVDAALDKQRSARRGVSAKPTVTFDSVAGIGGASRSKGAAAAAAAPSRAEKSRAASAFYSLLVLRGLGAVEVEQEDPYGEIRIARGPQCETLLEEYADEE